MLSHCLPPSTSKRAKELSREANKMLKGGCGGGGGCVVVVVVVVALNQLTSYPIGITILNRLMQQKQRLALAERATLPLL